MLPSREIGSPRSKAILGIPCLLLSDELKCQHVFTGMEESAFGLLVSSENKVKSVISAMRKAPYLRVPSSLAVVLILRFDSWPGSMPVRKSGLRSLVSAAFRIELDDTNFFLFYSLV